MTKSLIRLKRRGNSYYRTDAKKFIKNRIRSNVNNLDESVYFVGARLVSGFFSFRMSTLDSMVACMN